MSTRSEDEKSTVVLDLNALRKQKLKQEEDLANIAAELEFVIPPSGDDDSAPMDLGSNLSLPEVVETKAPPVKVFLFDFNSDFFAKSKGQFPKGYEYKVLRTLQELNQCLKDKGFQIVVFNYDTNPKAVNQLCAQIKTKMPTTKTMIMARAISPEKAKAHAKTASGAAGYYQFPLEASKVDGEFKKIKSSVKKAA